MPDDRDAIFDLVRQDGRRPVAPGARAMADWLGRRHPRVGAILFYGSCFRSGEDRDAVLDLYLLVDSYRGFYDRRRLAVANAALPPNVFYAEIPFEGRRARSKYAVMSFRDFAAAASRRAVLPAIWARFSQPAALLWARDDGATSRAEAALADAIVTMAWRTAPLVTGPVSPVEFWTAGYARSYRAEWRIEGEARAAALVSPPERFEALLRPALRLAGVPFEEAGEGRLRILLSAAERRAGLARWRWSAAATRLHSLPRLAKAALTFEGGVDYALWKVERHSGVHIEASDWQRRHPLLAALPLLWRAYRARAFH